MKDCDSTWTTVYSAVAGEIDATLGSSTGTQTVLETRRAAKVKLKVSGLTLAGGITLRVYIMGGDNATTPVYGYETDLGGTEFPLVIDGVTGDGNLLATFPVDFYNMKIDCTVSSADATAACTIQALRIYEGH